MEDKTHYGLDGGTLVAATTPLSEPTLRGLTAEEVMALSERLLGEADMLMEESDRHGAKGRKRQQVFTLGQSQGFGSAATLLYGIALALNEGGE